MKLFCKKASLSGFICYVSRMEVEKKKKSHNMKCIVAMLLEKLFPSSNSLVSRYLDLKTLVALYKSGSLAVIIHQERRKLLICPKSPCFS